MQNNNSQKELYESINVGLEDDMKFDWSDIAALTIAAFQILLPYALMIGISVAAFMLLFTLIMH